MESLLIDHPHPGVTRITLNRPEKLNAIEGLRETVWVILRP
ncbi:MAG: hypothetical protein AB7Q97_20500 [Gammaproteobacteria bacterium]